MSITNNDWAAALEDSAPVADIDIHVNEASDAVDDDVDLDSDGGMLEAVTASGEPSYDAVATEMVEDEAEVEEAEAVAEKLEDTAVQLESAAVAVEDRIAHDGGMTDSELHFMMIGLEGRVKNSRSLFPSTEAMTNNRLAASVEVLDRIKQGARAVWEALKNAINAILTKLRQWFGTTLRGAVKLKKRANAIQGAANSAKGKTPTNDKINLNSVQAFMYGKKEMANSGALATQRMESLAKTCRSILSKGATNSWDGYISQYSAAVEELMVLHSGEGEFDEAAAIAKVTSVDGYASAGIKTPFSEDDNTKFEGFTSTRSESLPGANFIYTITGTDGGLPTTLDAFRSAQAHRGVQLVSDGSDKDVSKTVQFTTMQPEEIISVAIQVEGVCDTIVEYETAWSRRDKTIGKVQSNIDKAVKKLDAKKGDYANQAKQQQVVGVLLRAIGSELKNAPKADAQIIQLSLKSCSAYLGYCTRSLAEYKAKKEKPTVAEETPAVEPEA